MTIDGLRMQEKDYRADESYYRSHPLCTRTLMLMRTPTFAARTNFRAQPHVDV